ncbi:MAG: outer membrane protein transport protein [Nitrospirota bacterium]
MTYYFRILLLLLFSATFCLLTSTTTYATNGHQLSAVGAYQQGMGGATTAAPYDASTSITNPAGMAMIGNRTDFSFQMFFPHRELSFAGGGETSGGSNYYLVPAVGWTSPMDDRNDWFFGGGMYGVSGMGVDYDTVTTQFPAANSQAHIYSQYQFWKMAPTVAYKSGGFAIGVALNLDYQALGFEQYFTNGGVKLFGFDLSEMQGAVGYGASIGFIYQPVPEFTVGAAYISKQNFGKFKWRLSAGDVVTQTGQISQDGIYTMDLDFPQQAAIGIAVKPFRIVTWTADVKWIHYSDTYDVVQLKGIFGGIGGTETDLTFGWDDVWVYATGLQIDFTPNFAVRAGYNYSTSPIDQADPNEVEYNLAFPAIVKQRVAGGFTYRLGRHWELTMAYMKAFKEEMTGISGTKISLEEQAVDFEVSYRF